MGQKKQRGKEGNAANYTTRNQALIRLQIKLPEFRRLCILKGIHPREPKKKVHGQNKTYYHVKDINFLLHEPLLQKSRDIKAHEKKVKRARAKLDEALAERLKSNAPKYSLDHLVRERYPSFIDALRDLDDALTMLHLFATLPADSKHRIPANLVQTARRLSLEWQAYITKTHALRKAFVSVKGIYYQAEVVGQKITWIVPHALSQVLPEDVDYRVMLTFLEFYETFVEFVNFKLYHSLGLKYPPTLDTKLEEVAAELAAAVSSLAGETESPQTGGQLENGAGRGEEETAEGPPEEEKLEELKEKLGVSVAAGADANGGVEEAGPSGGVEAEDDEGEDEEDDETKACRGLFKGLFFFLAREVPHESLLFLIRAFGGSVSWEGEGAPFPESDERITHQIVDRPTQGHRFLSREYVQPQWVYDSVNNRLLLPTEDYPAGGSLPPHLSPFVDNEAEGYLPEYAEQIQRLRDAAQGSLGGVLPLPGGAKEGLEEGAAAKAAAERGEDLAAAAKAAEVARLEQEYLEDLRKEVAGVPYSATLGGVETEERDEGGSEEEADEGGVSGKVTYGARAEDDDKAMERIMMPRKTKKLYEAMQMGIAAKKAGVESLKKKRKAAAAGKLNVVKKPRGA